MSAIPAAEIARAFHEQYEKEAPEHDWTTQELSRVSWDDLPANQRRLMVDVVHSLLAVGTIKAGEDDDEFAPFRDMFPEEQLPFMGIRIVATMDADGQPTWYAAIRGDIRTASVLGHLEMVKHWLLTSADVAE